MASIFDLASNSKGFEKLQQIKNNLQEEREKREAECRKYAIEVHRKKHIFDSYEQALDWAIKTQKAIAWHAATLFWEPEKNQFKSYEQEFDLDGIIPYDVIRYYTKEQLLKNIEEHIEYINKKYEDQEYLNWWLDEFGKLEYVYRIDYED